MIDSIKNKKEVLFFKSVLLILFLTLLLIPKNAFAYTITYNSTFGEFSNGTTENVVEYDTNHNVINGTYEEPIYNTGIDSSDFITWYKEYDAKNRVNIDEVSEDMTVYAAYEKITWRFDYTGDEQVFSLPIKVGLQLHVWGAQGGSIPGPLTVNHGNYTLQGGLPGGFGGYSTGLYDFEADQPIYINVGGQGEIAKGRNTISEGGYNGGGTGAIGNAAHLTNARSTGGGGATHISTNSGVLSSLINEKDSIAIVAGGGGGMYYFRNDTWYSGYNMGHGGGYIGGGANRWTSDPNNPTDWSMSALGGQQTGADEYFGQGYNAIYTSGPVENGGGGGGWYGGKVVTYESAGGSGYIGNTIENTRHMSAYSGHKPAFTSDDDQTKTIITENASEDPIEDYAKLGNGYAMAELTRLNIRYINEFDGTDFTKDQYVGSLAQEFEIAQRPGYTVAWYNGNDVWNFNEPVNFDMTLEARYTPIIYNINYNVTNGTVSGNPNSYTIESDDIIINNPTPNEYYVFNGWTGTGLLVLTKELVISKGFIGDREYTANIELTEYSITYDLDGGEENSNPTSYNVETDDITLNRPFKEGHTFIGWTGTELTDKTLDVIIPSGSHISRTYKANYEINHYNVKIIYNGEEVYNQIHAWGDFIEKPEIDEALAGYEHVWRTGTTEFDFTKPITDDTTIIVTDELIVYEVKYYSNIALVDVENLNNKTTYTVLDSDFKINNPSDPDEYHYFVGWTTDIDKEEDLNDNYEVDTSLLKNIKLYAIFQTSPYVVSFDSDGGSLVDPIRREGTENIGKLPTTLKEGYTFIGWFVNDKKIDGSFHSRVDVIAKAKWEKNTEVLGAETSINPKTGDNIFKYVFVLIISVIGLIGLFIIKKIVKNKKVQK